MAIPFSNFHANPLNFQKFKKNPNNLNIEKPKKTNPNNHTNLKSFWVFLSSIFIYISIFYIFNLSPSTLFCTTKFWFFISNTLILIIAADFVSFSSSKQHDFYDEFVKKSSKSTTFPSFDDKIVAKTMSNDMKEEVKPPEKIINMVVPSTSVDHNNNHQIIEYEPQILTIKENGENPNQESKKKTQEKRKAKCARSNSDRAIIMAAAAAAEEEEGEKLVLHRTLSERNDETILEDNEFSRMSNEELNRRVEEFIRRFNRQIRLQAIENRQKSGDEQSF